MALRTSCSVLLVVAPGRRRRFFNSPERKRDIGLVRRPKFHEIMVGDLRASTTLCRSKNRWEEPVRFLASSSSAQTKSHIAVSLSLMPI